jgi:hypothetical protein
VRPIENYMADFTSFFSPLTHSHRLPVANTHTEPPTLPSTWPPTPPCPSAPPPPSSIRECRRLRGHFIEEHPVSIEEHPVSAPLSLPLSLPLPLPLSQALLPRPLSDTSCPRFTFTSLPPVSKALRSLPRTTNSQKSVP